jgi:hypothetical protein
MTIIEKRKDLIKTFHDSIKHFKYGYHQLKSFMDVCKLYKQELITLRNLGYKHDGKIEQSLLWIYNTTQKIKKEIMDHFQRDFGFIRSRIYRFVDLDTWNPRNFYEIESIINQIEKNVETFKKYVDHSLKPLNANLRVLKSKISVIQYYKLIFEEYKSDLQLRPNELPVCAFKRITFVKFGDNDLPSKKGVLFITNKRIIFIYKKGFIRKTREELFNLDLPTIQNAVITGKIFKKLKVITNDGPLIFKSKEKIYKAIINYLNVSMNFTKYSNDDNYLVQRISTMDIELSDLKDSVNNHIAQILSKRDKLNPNRYLNRNDDDIARDKNLRERINKNMLYRSQSNNIPKNYQSNPQIIKDGINRIPTNTISSMPQPGSINITIPISQNSSDYQRPVAEVLSDSNKQSDRRQNLRAQFYRYRNKPELDNKYVIREQRKNTSETRPIVKLYEDKFSIEKTLENIETLFNNGRITPEVYFKQYRPLQKELYTIMKMIRDKEG